MIARVWRGWTARQNAEAYERHFRETVLPGLRRLDGFRGARLLRREEAAEVEFVAITRFESLEAVRGFAGPDPDVAVVEAEARRLLSRYERRVKHYTVVPEPAAPPQKG